MKLGLISDVHANKPALDAVLNDMPAVDKLLCAGDIVGILGWNEQVVDLVKDKCDYIVHGNHDARVRSDFAYAPSFPAARDEHRIVTEQLRSDQIGWLSNLPDRLESGEWMMGHARPVYLRDPGYPCHGYAQGDYGTKTGEFTRIGPHIDGKVAVMGHTHEQHAVDCAPFEGQSGLVVNPGSVGVGWDEPAEYAVVNTASHEYELRSVEYDYDRVKDQLAEQGTPVGKYDRTKPQLYNTTR